MRERQGAAGPLVGAAVAFVFLGLLAGLGCQPEQKVTRLRPPPVPDRATLPPAPELKPTAEVIRYPDGSYSVDGLLRESEKLVGEEVRLKGFVRDVSVCDPQIDATCTSAPHAFVIDDPARPKRAMLVVGSLQSRLPQLERGRGETLEGRVEQVSPDGRFIRARGMLVLPDVEPPPAPVPAPGADAGAPGTPGEGATAPQP
jgi:hypothetical protein